jgi:predicted nucleic-acid-binding protein
MLTYCYPSSSKSKEDIKNQLVKTLKSALLEIIGSLEIVPKNIDLNNVIIANKFCESVNFLDRFLNYFLASELGHEAATELINNSFYTVVEQDQQAFIDSIISVFTRKNLDELSNLISASGKRLSWKEYFIFALDKISNGFESLLMRYSSSADQTLIYELQNIKDLTETMIDSVYSNNSQDMKETYPNEVRSKIYAEFILKPYLLQLIRVRILVLSYSNSP